MNTNNAAGVGLLDVILVVFVILKLAGIITWSWWVVLIPLWIGLILIIIYIVIVVYIAYKR